MGREHREDQGEPLALGYRTNCNYTYIHVVKYHLHIEIECDKRLL